MNRGIVRAGLALVLVALLLGLTFVVIRNGELRHERAALPDYGVVPAFELTGRAGETIGLADLEGRFWVVDFIFTRCTGTCPLLSSRMFAVQSALAPDDPVRLVSVSVDPGYDTPEVMAAYAERWKADPDRWLFLTGKKSTIYAWIRDGFHLGVEQASGDQRSAGAEDFIHSTRMVLVDRQGRIRGYYDGVDEGSVDQLLADLHTLMAEPAGDEPGASS